MTWLVFLVGLVAWSLLALGLPRHHAEWFGRAPTPLQRRLLRGHGWAGLGLALALSLRAHGPELGIVLWAVAMMLAAMAWALLLAARARFSPAAAPPRGAAGARRARPAPPRS